MMAELPVSAEVVVCGTGLAGHCAALAAADAGAEVLLLEKTAEAGGSSVMAAGSFAFAGTDLQRAAGFDDTPEKLRADLLKAGGHRNDPALVDLYVREQLATYEWLRAQGVVFQRVSLSGGTSLPRSHATNPRQVIQALQARLGAMPRIRAFTGVAARRLHREAEEGRVAALEVEQDGRTARIAIGRGVVLATGGFSRNRRLLQTFAPDLAEAVQLGGRGNTGDGLLMAQALGAGLADMGFVAGTFGASLAGYPEPQPEATEPVILMAMYRGAIMVNRDGRRFADESQSYKVLGKACAQQPGAVAIQVFDQRTMEQSATAPTVNDFQGGLARGLVKQAPTLAALAPLVALDPAVLEATLARYNADVIAGRDTEFGRTALGSGFGALHALAMPPFYAYPCGIAVSSTYAGLTVDAGMRVLDVFGRPIDRLFGAGELVGGFHGKTYLSGSSLGKAAISGRVAGAAAARAG
jgi:fumarate reductase flavoprotein subunit